MISQSILFVNSIYDTRTISTPLAIAESSQLNRHLIADSSGSLFSAAISLSQGIINIDQALSSWAVIKLYYSIFYSIRSYLMLDGNCIFYYKRRPYLIDTSTGAIPQKKAGTSHEVAFDLFKKLHNSHYILSQDIEAKEPFVWYKEKREHFNYKISKFPEPDLPSETEHIHDYGIRKLCSECITDSKSIYPFLPDYAILGFPLLTFLHAVQHFRSVRSTNPFTADEISYLTKISKDKSGPIRPFLSVISSI
jgi:hypothetical protein